MAPQSSRGPHTRRHGTFHVRLPRLLWALAPDAGVGTESRGEGGMWFHGLEVAHAIGWSVVSCSREPQENVSVWAKKEKRWVG